MRRAWLVLIAVVALSAPALAEPDGDRGVGPPGHEEGSRPPGPPPHRGGRRHGPPPLDRVLERHAERLGIDAETRARISAISDAARERRPAERKALRSLHDALRETLNQEPPDEARVMELADQIGAAETERRKQSLRRMLSIRGLLSPEQRAELVKIHAEEEAARPHKRRRPFWRGEQPKPDPQP